MSVYLLKSAACALLLWLVYRFFLEKEKMHRFNRLYLLLSVSVSCTVPLIGLPVISPSLPAIDSVIPVVFPDDAVTAAPVITEALQPSGISAVPLSLTSYTTPILVCAYAAVVLFLLARFSRNLYALYTAGRNGETIYRNGVRFIVVNEPTSCYTFFQTVFISRNDYDSWEADIVAHELAHIKQQHTLDILFIELVRIFFWFNPIYLFYKRSIQLNHEFLADDAVIGQGSDIPAYQHLLLDRIGLASHLSLSSRFNYSITKKRLVMMTQQKSLVRATMKKLALLPLCIACVSAFGFREVMPTPLSNDAMVTQDTTIKRKSNPTPLVHEMVMTKHFLKDVPFTREGLSAQEFREYLDIQGRYVDTTKKSPTEYGKLFDQITEAERSRLQELFLKMSREQQYSVRIVFQKGFPPHNKRKPTQEQFERWKDPAQYGIWLNGRYVSNGEMEKYNAADFSYYNGYSLNYTDAQKKYIQKRYNRTVMYKVQLEVMTNDYYDSYYRSAMDNLKKNPYMMVTYWAKRPA